MPFLPKQLATLVGGDTMLARVSTNVRAAVQPTLDFLNTYLQAGPDGSLQILRNLVAQANVLVNGSLTVQGPSLFASAAQMAASLTVGGWSQFNNDVTIQKGNLIVRSRAGNGVVFVPFAPSLPVFYTTNVGETSALFLIMGDGSVYGSAPWSTTGSLTTTSSLSVGTNATIGGTMSANSVVSAQGFQHKLPPVYWNGTVAAGANQGMAPGAALPAQFIMDKAGSVTGMYMSVRTNATSTCYGQLLKNGGAIAVTVGLANSTTQNFVNYTAAKGALPFNPGDILKVNFYNGAATPFGGYFYGYIYLTVEYSS